MRDVVVAELALAAFWSAYATARHRRLGFAMRHPLRTLGALRDLRALPVLDVAPSDSAGGRALLATLEAPGFLGTPMASNGPAVLEVPDAPGAYRAGPRRQTLRRKLRAAERHGLATRMVDDHGERLEFLARANRAEQRHPDETYRTERPSNDDLLDHDLWMVVEDRNQEPLLLCVIPTDGAWATLRYFRTLGSGPDFSNSRYLGTAVLVDELAVRGVRWLIDTEHPGAQTNGLRHFQRMLGFRYARLRIRADGRPGRARSGRADDMVAASGSVV